MMGGWVAGPIVWIALLLVIIAIALFVGAARRARRTGNASPVISLTLTIAASWAAASVLGGAITVLVTLLSPTVTIDVPVREFWPELPDTVQFEGTTATRDGGGFTTASLSITGLSTGARVLWATSHALGVLVPATVAALIAVACFQLLAGRTFAPVVSRMTMITAAVVAFGASAAEVVGGMAGSLASAELFDYTGARWDEIAGVESPLDSWLPHSTIGITFSIWPIAAGLAFLALAGVLRYGSALQQQTTALQRETEGLV
jgi:hypothetical protein